MGTRAVVVFKNGDTGRVSPGVYVHNYGRQIPEFLREAAPLLRFRDAGYSAARFCAFCAEKIPGKTGLGLVGSPGSLLKGYLENEYSHGDAGVFVVDVTTGYVENFDGYEGEDKGFHIDIDHTGGVSR